MPLPNDPRLIGRAWVTPDAPVVGGAWGTWRVTYEVGAYAYDERARLKIAWRFASDWAKPQFSDPGAANYATVRIDSRSEGAVPSLSYEPRGQVRPWLKCLSVSVADGSLYPGDRVHVTLGERGGGGRGARAQTFRERGFEFRVFVDPFGTELYTALSPSPSFDIIGGALHRLVAVAPTTVRRGEPFEALIRAEDAWGNPCQGFDGEIALESRGAPIAGLPSAVRVARGDPAVRRLLGLTLEEPASEALVVATHGERQAESNVIRCLGTAERKTWWADLHGQSGATVGTGTIADYYSYGRDVALLDAICHQGNDFQVTADEWRLVREETARFHEDGRYVVLLGWEWSGMTPAGGDRNVIFRGPDGPLHRTSHAEVDDTADADSDRYPLSELFAELGGRDDVLLVPHVGGRYADIVGFHDPRLEPVVEVSSDWGRFEWLLEDALRLGYRVGVVAGSDGHKGRPGASHPGAGEFGAYGGLACLLCEELTREAVFDAVRARRCYATSLGQRIHVELEVNGLQMGAEGRAGASASVEIAGRVLGTGPLERVELFRGLERISILSPYSAGSFEGSRRYRVAWAGSRVRGRDRTTAWDGRLELSAGRILDAAPFAFDNPELGIVERRPTSVSWRSTTSGDDDGLDLTLEATPDAELRLRTEVIDVDIPIAPLVDGTTFTQPAGGIDLRVYARRLPARDLTAELRVGHSDDRPPLGVQPYWLRATQEDGAQAWTSPVYLDVG